MDKSTGVLIKIAGIVIYLVILAAAGFVGFFIRGALYALIFVAAVVFVITRLYKLCFTTEELKALYKHLRWMSQAYFAGAALMVYSVGDDLKSGAGHALGYAICAVLALITAAAMLYVGKHFTFAGCFVIMGLVIAGYIALSLASGRFVIAAFTLIPMGFMGRAIYDAYELRKAEKD